MTKNVGKTDKMLRIAAAVIIAGAGIYFQSWLGLLALIPLGTAFMGWCPLYVPLGINTDRK